MKSINCKTRTHFTIQVSKNVKNTNKRIKEIPETYHKKPNEKETNDLSNNEQSLILKLWRKYE